MDCLCHLPLEDSGVYQADCLTSADQMDCFPIPFLGEVDTVIKLGGIKSWFGDVGLPQVTYNLGLLSLF